jgi:hypothetical protein
MAHTNKATVENLDGNWIEFSSAVYDRRVKAQLDTPDEDELRFLFDIYRRERFATQPH